MTKTQNNLLQAICQAGRQNLVLTNEMNADLRALINQEEQRQEKSLKSRLAHAKREAAKITASPPSHHEVFRAKVFIDQHVLLPDVVAARHEIHIVDSPAKASIFVTLQPWAPNNLMILWYAVLSGAWIMTPAMIIDQSGPARKFKPALSTKREVWVSDAVRDRHTRIWLAILESMQQSPDHKWILIHSAAAYARAKVRAGQQKRSAQVLALCADDEVTQNPGLAHVLTCETFLAFISAEDEDQTSYGMAGM